MKSTRLRKVIISAILVAGGVPLVLVLVAALTMKTLDESNGAIVSSGEERNYLLYVPKSVERSNAVPLVISLHSGAMWPAQQMNMSRWNHLADEHGFIVVYPSGTGFPKTWRDGLDDGLGHDVTFIADLIDSLRAQFNIDASRIYANGFSNGAGMAHVLSCALSERIAAVGLVASASALPSTACRAPQPVPMIAFHGDADPIVPYDGGPLGDPFNPAKLVFPSVRDWVATWARRNQCLGDVVESTFAPGVSVIEYTRCTHDAVVVLYTVHGGGHTWPGGKPLPQWHVGSTTNSVDATGKMWAFFRGHSLASP